MSWCKDTIILHLFKFLWCNSRAKTKKNPQSPPTKRRVLANP